MKVKNIKLLSIIGLVVVISMTIFFTSKENTDAKTIAIKKVSEFYDTKEINSKIKLRNKIKNKTDLKNFTNAQKNLVNVLKSENIIPEEKNILEDSMVVLTFTSPIQINELELILNKSNANLIDFETKFTDINENWVTGNHNKLNENFLSDEIIINENLKYIGITSTRIKINLLNEFNVLTNNNKIYCADLTDSLIRIDKKDYKNKLKIQVPDFAWEIDKLK